MRELGCAAGRGDVVAALVQHFGRVFGLEMTDAGLTPAPETVNTWERHL
jgi:hypothetical protein